MLNTTAADMPDPITLNCVPIAATDYQTNVYEEFIVRCNLNADYIGTAVSYFVHPMIALPQTETIGNISEKDLTQSGKLMFIKDFLKFLKAAATTKPLEVAFVCSNEVTETVLRQMIKGRGYKTTDLVTRGFFKGAFGLVASTANPGKKDKQSSNQGNTIGLIMVADSGISIEDVIPNQNVCRELHTKKTLYLNCIDTPEMKLHNYRAINPRSLTPFDYLSKLKKEDFEALFKKSSRRTPPEKVVMWNNYVATDIVNWTIDYPSVKDYRFNFCNSNREMIEFYFNFKSSPVVPSKHLDPKSRARLASTVRAASQYAPPARSASHLSKRSPTDSCPSSSTKYTSSNTRYSAPLANYTSTHHDVKGIKSRELESSTYKASASSSKRPDSDPPYDCKPAVTERGEIDNTRGDAKRLKTEPLDEMSRAPTMPPVLEKQTTEIHCRDPKVREYNNKVNEDNPPTQISNQATRVAEAKQVGTVEPLGVLSPQPLDKSESTSTATPSPMPSHTSLSKIIVQDDYSLALEKALKKFQSDIQGLL
ncbi:hypothetical protein BY458DRAFT_486361 [Sporodiniella umbellata]|nr:hypothetical protein BY458DRAFT_486361 [Sporodiniella umbellata]